jgi:potassium channel subfamily K
VPTTNLGRAIVMPYAIIGIISLGLVVTSIRTVLVERTHVRKRLMNRSLRKQQKRVQFLKERLQEYSVQSLRTHRRQQVLQDGVTIRISAIELSALETYERILAREQVRKSHLKRVVIVREISALGLAFLAFSVCCLHSTLTAKVYWVAGAAIFSTIEGWTYFDGLYFCMIFFLTIGYVYSQEKELIIGGLCRFVACWASDIHCLLSFCHSNHDYFDLLHV